jgi:site-specific recombinase XerD
MLSSFIQPFLDYCHNLCYAKESVKELRRYISAFNEFVNKQFLIEIRHIQYNHLLNFAISAPATASTVKARVWTLKKFYGFLIVKSYIKGNIKNSKYQPQIIFFHIYTHSKK